MRSIKLTRIECLFSALCKALLNQPKQPSENSDDEISGAASGVHLQIQLN